MVFGDREGRIEYRGMARRRLRGCCWLWEHAGSELMAPVGTFALDSFVSRDVRKDAARNLSCQVPNVRITMGPWAGSAGNVIAYGCGYQINYYLRCITNHQCSPRIRD